MAIRLGRRATAAVVGVAIAATLTACANNEEEAAPAAQSTPPTAAEAEGEGAADSASFPRTIETQDKDRKPAEITIEKQPERIVSASVSLTGALLALDAPVVGSGGGNPKAPMFEEETGFAESWEDIAEDKGVEPLYTIGSASAEAILEQDPDLVVMSNVGADTGAEIYDQLKDVVPVQVIDYTDQSWEDTLKEVAESTGLEDKADEVIADYQDAVADAKGEIHIEGPVNVIALAKEGAVNFFTKESAQGRIFTDLGIELAEPADDLVGTSEQGKDRGDVKAVNAENVPLALDGKSVFVLNLDPSGEADEKVRGNEQLAETPAVSENRVYGLDAEFFRIDPIAAKDLVEHLKEEFKD